MRNGGEGEAGAAAGRATRIVLAFHRVVAEPRQPHDLGCDRFVRLVETVAASGEAAATLEPPAGGRSTILTFDDATADHAAVAEHLAARGVPAIFFVPSGRVGCADHLAREQVAALATLGHGVGSHGATHRLLDHLSRAELIDELRSSKDELEQIVGHAVETFAPPGGVLAPDLAALVAQSGYRACRTMQWGVYVDERQRWTVPVVPVTELTVRRGWVDAVLSEARLPRVMQVVWASKSALPPGLHRRLRAAATTLAHRARA